MKKSILVCALLVLGLAVNAMPMVYAEGECAAGASLQETMGNVLSINPDDNTIVIQSAAADETQAPQEMVISVTESTLIGDNETELQLTDIAAGAKVSVKYTTEADGKAVASTVTVEQ